MKALIVHFDSIFIIVYVYSPPIQLTSHSYATSSVTPPSIAGGLMTRNVKVVGISATSDAVYRTVQWCPFQMDPG